MCREFQYRESNITIHDQRCEHYETEPDHHEGDDHGDHGGAGGGGHGLPIHIEIDGKTIIAHELSDGKFHTHELPYVAFPSLEDLAKMLVDRMKARNQSGQPHGH